MECELGREIFEAHKDLTIQVQTHEFLLRALLSVIEEDALLKVKKILELQAEDFESQGVAASALHDALRIVSVFSDNGDPREAFRLIPGGKKD